MLADFDTVFVNRFYQSRFDDVNATDVGSIAAAAAVAASALHALAAAPEAPALQVMTAHIATTPCSTVCEWLLVHHTCSGTIQSVPRNWPVNVPQVDSVAIAATVSQLQGCLVASAPAMQCDLAQALITPSGAPVQHYLGVLRTLSGDSQVPPVVVRGESVICCVLLPWKDACFW